MFHPKTELDNCEFKSFRCRLPFSGPHGQSLTNSSLKRDSSLFFFTTNRLRQRLSLSACTLGVPGAQGLGRGLASCLHGAGNAPQHAVEVYVFFVCFCVFNGWFMIYRPPRPSCLYQQPFFGVKQRRRAGVSIGEPSRVCSC